MGTHITILEAIIVGGFSLLVFLLINALLEYIKSKTK
jgi:hypothetical protein